MRVLFETNVQGAKFHQLHFLNKRNVFIQDIYFLYIFISIDLTLSVFQQRLITTDNSISFTGIVEVVKEKT